jgi:hypothetical protein
MRTFQSLVVASGIVMTAAVVAGARPQESRSQPQAPTAPATVEGCLYREVDVPGRHVPDAMRSRTVTDEDYVLARTRIIKGSAPSPVADTKAGQAAAPTDAMYKVKGSSLKLGEHAGHRVQVDGTFDHADRAGNPTTFSYDLVILNGTALRQLPGDCPKSADK